MKALDLAHGRRVYDWWGCHRVAYRTTNALMFLGPRDGCGGSRSRRSASPRGRRCSTWPADTGVNFALLEATIGPHGRLIALDSSL